MISPLSIPGLFVLPAEAGAGKTLVAGAIANWFWRQGGRVGVSVPVQTRAQRRREGLVSQEAELLAAWADARHPLDLICPARYEGQLPPAVTARVKDRRTPEWEAIDRSLQLVARESDVMIVQAPGPLMMPLDHERAVIDLVRALRAPVVLVARAGFEWINPLVLAARALRGEGVEVAGFVVNRYPAESPTVEQEQSLRELEKWAKLPMLCVVPEEKFAAGPQLPPGITAAADLVDWGKLARRTAANGGRGSGRGE